MSHTREGIGRKPAGQAGGEEKQGDWRRVTRPHRTCNTNPISTTYESSQGEIDAVAHKALRAISEVTSKGRDWEDSVWGCGDAAFIIDSIHLQNWRGSNKSRVFWRGKRSTSVLPIPEKASAAAASLQGRLRDDGGPIDFG
jgi:hypothetical protein